MRKMYAYLELAFILFGRGLEWIFFITTSLILMHLAPTGEGIMDTLKNQHNSACFSFHATVIIILLMVFIVPFKIKNNRESYFLFWGTITMWGFYFYDNFLSMEKIQHLYEVEAMIFMILFLKLISYYIKSQFKKGGIQFSVNQKKIIL